MTIVILRIKDLLAHELLVHFFGNETKDFKLIYHRIPDICANILLLKMMAATNFVF